MSLFYNILKTIPPLGVRGLLVPFLLFFTLLSHASGRRQNYYPVGRELVCVNGSNRYTRSLYGSHSAFRLETSDRPVFALYRKGDCRNIQLYLNIDGTDTKLDDDALHCMARYSGGKRTYNLLLPEGAQLDIDVIAMLDREGVLWRFRTSGLPASAQLKAVLAPCRSSKFVRNGDLGVDDMTKFEAAADSVTGYLQTVAWQASGTTYLVFDDDKLSSAGQAQGQFFDSVDSQCQQLMSRVEFNTPDPLFNTLGSILMAAADGLWDGYEDEGGTGTWQHGCVGWRTPLAGWRGCYVGDAVGWFDRSYHHYQAYAKSQITDTPPTIPHPTQDAKTNLARAEKTWGTQMYSNGYISRYPNGRRTMHHYDMNLNYIDGLLWHLSYDADTLQLREFWPTLTAHLAWEKRNYDPDGDHLYDAYCCIWASDALYYNSGAVTHSSAYNYRGNRLAARIAEILGYDPTPYRDEANAILQAMNQRLWMPDRGHWAEYQDFMGHRRLHPAAALWSIYTPIDCGACTPEQAWQATMYVDRDIPRVGSLISTSSWMPYVWSTNNVAHEEVANMALAYFQAGRTDRGYELLKADLTDEMLMGQCPGNIGQISYYDKVRNEAYRDFGDNIGVTSRALINGLFGIRPDALNGCCYIRPSFPEEWTEASIRTPYLSYKYRKVDGRDEFYDIEQHFPQQLQIIVLPRIQPASFQQIPSMKSAVSAPQYITRMGLDPITPDTLGRHLHVDLSKVYNANVDDIFKNEYLTPRSPYTTLQIPLHGIGQWCHPDQMADIAPFRLPEMADGSLYDTHCGLKFRVPYTGHNIAYTSLWDNYPDAIDIPLTAVVGRKSVSAAYLMLAGTTNSMQSRIDNGIVVARYKDGTCDTLHLENPINWPTINEAYNYDDEAFWSAPVHPLRFLLSTGEVTRQPLQFTARGGVGGDVGRVTDFDIPGGAGVILKMPINPTKRLKSLRLETLSNDVVIGLMAVTLGSPQAP